MATYKKQQYLFMTLDPVHVGTGGYRLGRVDNSIVREPATKIPKIPGSSLHGAARSYAARLYEDIEAAGKDHSNVEKPGIDPICYTFGYIDKGNQGSEEAKAHSGVVSIFDAHVLLFPVHSIAGPVWVSTYKRLKDAELIKDWKPPGNWKPESVYINWQRKEPLNLGWLMLDVAGQVKIMAPKAWGKDKRWEDVLQRLVLVKEELFSQVVNSNLEVRTSVAIDPESGAAEERALFTYEALPRATFLTTEVLLDDYQDKWPLLGDKCGKTKKCNSLPGCPWKGPLDVVKAGLRLIEWFGIGGMGTRGFGRMVIIDEPLEKSLEKSFGGSDVGECH